MARAGARLGHRGTSFRRKRTTLSSRRSGRQLLVAQRSAVAEVQQAAVAEAVERKSAPGEEEEPPDERWLMVGLVAAAYVVWTMDKVNMSVAVLPMASEYGWDPGEVGVIQSALFWGYASTQVIGGFLATRFGGKSVLLGAVVLWSAMTAIAPLAASVSTQVFIASRVLVGIGEGLAPSAGIRIVATWVPEAERSRAVATLGSGKNAGSIVGLLLAPLVIGAYGWPAMFYSFGALGLIWAVGWAVLGKDREPGTASAAAAPGAAEETPIPWLTILSTPALWAVVVTHFCVDWGTYALLTWTPSYLNKELGYDLAGSSELTVVPSVLAVAAAVLAGNLADGLGRGGMDLTSVRKLMQSIGFIVPGACLAALGTINAAQLEPGSPLPVALLTLGIAGTAFSLAGLYSSHADLSAKYSGLVQGFSNTFGAMAGVGSNAFAGYALATTGSWSKAIFMPCVAFYALGLVAYLTVYDATPRDWDEEARQQQQQLPE